MTHCQRCSRRLDRFTVRRSLLPIAETISPGHKHHGLPYHKYGICSGNHYTIVKTTRVEWSPCMKCGGVPTQHKKPEKLVDIIRKERKRAKSLHIKKRVPKFLVDEFERHNKAPPSSPDTPSVRHPMI
jgi:hypothetical protein